MKNNNYLTFGGLLVLISIAISCSKNSSSDNNGIAIYEQNPFYWSYNGEPILLLGATKEDNIFQIDDLEAHLKLLDSVGGNYIRCTLSSRDQGNLKPYSIDDQGLYDLDQPNPEYWRRLQKLFEISAKLDIIVQMEIWATYDFYWGDGRWSDNPFNPMLNRNYSSAQSRLPDSIDYPAQLKINPFFKSIPELDNNPLLIKYQQNFVDRVLELSLMYDNVLYCIDNETNAHHSWGKYWSDYIRNKVDNNGKKIFITEMWDHWDPTNGMVPGAKVQHPDLGGWYAQYTNPELHQNANYSYSLKDTLSYDFMDISNNNAQDGQLHYNTGIWIRNAVKESGKIRPVNNVKIYGADESQLWSGSVREAEHRFWRNIFAGHASARFHRPSAGIGLNFQSAMNIRSMRMLTDNIDLFSFEPSNRILGDRKPNEAYCMSNGEGEYLVYFPDGGVVMLNVPAKAYNVQTLQVAKAHWMKPRVIKFPGVLAAPHNESWAFIIKAVE
ncbi:MAG: hypothetical protein WBM43_05655 [Flavobacteriaceae bacterium]